jgi:transposase
MHPSGASSFSYIIQLAGIGMKDAEIREKLNVSERNWYRWLARTDDDGVENRVRLLRATVAAVSKTHQAMFDAAINGKVGAARELLARLGAYGRKRA